MADMFEREGEDCRALEGHIAAAEEDETDLAVRFTRPLLGPCRIVAGNLTKCYQIWPNDRYH